MEHLETCEIKQQLEAYIDTQANKITALADDIFDHPELGLQEVRSCGLLCDYLEQDGFQVERGLGNLPTAFRGTYTQGSGGPSIGLLCEYDALASMGHGCAHHMQGPVMLAAATAIKHTLKDGNYKLVVYGTPAEETTSGKIQMIKDGMFKDIDVALMVHGAPTTTTDVQSLAMSRYIIRYHGINSHAAIKPEDGRSALDAALLMFNGIEFMREHVKDDIRIHYTILNAGGPANSVQKYSESLVYLRGYNRPYLDTVVSRFMKVVEGAALMTETTAEIIEDKVLNNKIPVLSLNKLVMDSAVAHDAPTIRPPREKTGSTDFGNVMYLLPGTCLRIAFVPEDASSHSQAFLDAGKAPQMHHATILAAKILADVSAQLIQNPTLMKEIQDEFLSRKSASQVKSL